MKTSAAEEADTLQSTSIEPIFYQYRRSVTTASRCVTERLILLYRRFTLVTVAMSTDEVLRAYAKFVLHAYGTGKNPSFLLLEL